MEVLAKGRNYDNNQPKILNVNDNGELKTEMNDKLDSIENNLNWINKYNILNDIRMLRNKGFCYNLSVNISSTDQYTNVLELFNKSTSNYNIYLYNISYTLSNTTEYYVETRVRLYDTITSISGSSITPTNLKINGNTLPSDITCKNSLVNTLNNNKNLLLNSVRFTTQTEVEVVEYEEFLKEMIEIPAGHGIVCRLEQYNIGSQPSYNNLHFSINLRFFIMDNNYSYPFTEDDELNSIDTYFNSLTFNSLNEIDSCVIS